MTNKERIRKMYQIEYKSMAGITMLRDAMAYFDSRVEERNCNKTVDQLLEDWYEIYFEFYHPTI